MAKHPDRSDPHLPPEEAEKREEEIRDYFDAKAPLRHSKPSRSEYSSQYTDALPPSDEYPIPELEKFRDLEAEHPLKVTYDGSEVVEEYVETEYYKDLTSIDKQHYATGTGFIKVEKTDDRTFTLPPVSDASPLHPSSRGNPATNEWIPAAETVIPDSHKPNRSDA